MQPHGWFAAARLVCSRITRGRGFGLIGDLIVGVIGAYLGGWMFNQLGISLAGIFGSLVTAVIGASVLLCIRGRLFLSPTDIISTGSNQ